MLINPLMLYKPLPHNDVYPIISINIKYLSFLWKMRIYIHYNSQNSFTERLISISKTLWFRKVFVGIAIICIKSYQNATIELRIEMI